GTVVTADRANRHHDRARGMCCKARLCPRPVLFLFGPVIAAAAGEAMQRRLPPFLPLFQELSGEVPMAGCTFLSHFSTLQENTGARRGAKPATAHRRRPLSPHCGIITCS